MLKLPVCPYCGARFFYRSVKSSAKKKTKMCPYCNKEFIIYKKFRYLLFLAAFILLVAVNWFFLTVPAMNLTFLATVTALGVGAAWALVPFTVRYRKKGAPKK
jgi:hypothetical protein